MDRPSPDAQAALLRLASAMMPAYGTILVIGPDGGAIAPFLPAGCTLLPASLIPDETEADVVTLLGSDLPAPALAAAAARLGRPFVCTWPTADADALVKAMRRAGLRLQCDEQVAPALGLFKWVLGAQETAARARRVLVLSHHHVANFGDRLGYHVLNSLLPAEVEVIYGTLRPWSVPEGDYDLLIIGIGNSLLPKDAANPELVKLLDRIPRAIGIFGTQYREQYLRSPQAAEALDRILGRVTTWWARYEEDIFAFGRGRGNVRHLGDWLIAASPLARPTLDQGLAIPATIYEEEVSLDRLIQRIQSYRIVSSGRLHPLLVALSSAESIAYQEQRFNDRDPARSDAEEVTVSGKFSSLLYDVFGRTFAEDRYIPVDRVAVIAYRQKVQANMEGLRAELCDLLGHSLPSPGPSGISAP